MKKALGPMTQAIVDHTDREQSRKEPLVTATAIGQRDKSGCSSTWTPGNWS